MSLDQNLFTLLITPDAKDANISDLVDPAGTVHYRKERVPGSVYTINVYGMRPSATLRASLEAGEADFCSRWVGGISTGDGLCTQRNQQNQNHPITQPFCTSTAQIRRNIVRDYDVLSVLPTLTSFDRTFRWRFTWEE